MYFIQVCVSPLSIVGLDYDVEPYTNSSLDNTDTLGNTDVSFIDSIDAIPVVLSFDPPYMGPERTSTDDAVYYALTRAPIKYYDAPSTKARVIGTAAAGSMVMFRKWTKDSAWVTGTGNNPRLFFKGDNLEIIPAKTSTDTEKYYAMTPSARGVFSAPSVKSRLIQMLPAKTLLGYYKWTESGSWVYRFDTQGRRVFIRGGGLIPVPLKTSTDSMMYTSMTLTSRGYFTAPSVESKVVRMIPYGTLVNYHKWTENGSWVYGTYQGKTVFFRGTSLLSVPSKTSKDSKVYYARVDMGRSFWSAPSTKARKVGSLYEGTIISYQKWTEDGSWLYTKNESGQRMFFQGMKLTPHKGPVPGAFFGTYIDVNLSSQKVHYVVNNQVRLATDVVTGKPSTPTPAGTFYILYKQSPAVLVGADYAAPVSFWMPFTSVGHGFHDANWQPWFGGNRWTYAGSHGCVNMPYWAAAELYRLAPAGSRVSIHW